MKSFDYEEMVDERKALIDELHTVRKNMRKDNKDGIDVFHELIERIHDVHKRKK